MSIFKEIIHDPNDQNLSTCTEEGSSVRNTQQDLYKDADLRMLGCLRRFISCTSFSMLALLLAIVFIFRAITCPVTRCCTLREKEKRLCHLQMTYKCLYSIHVWSSWTNISGPFLSLSTHTQTHSLPIHP